MTKRVAIHQPNFFPWLGFFEKVIRSDVFIILDTAQIPKSGASYQNRVELLAQGKKWTASLSIKRAHGKVLAIKDVEILADAKKRKIAQSLFYSYSKAKYFEDEFKCISELIMSQELNLVNYNMNGIYYALENLGIAKCKIVRSSNLGFWMSKENLSELIVKMVISVGGDTFLSGPRSAWHLDQAVFYAAGLDIEFTEYQSPEYPQIGSRQFEPGLSFIDAALNLGWNGVKQLLSHHAENRL